VALVTITLVAFFGVLGLIILIGIVIYNKLVTLCNRFKNAFAQIDVQLKRRYDLIPNLVETTKGYLKHEQETLQSVIAARNQAVQANASAASNPGDHQVMKSLSSAEGVLGGALGRLFAVVESYPNLKGDQPVADLMEELRSTENKVGFARQAYNDAVTTYNTYREQFPQIVIASVTNFQSAELFELTNEEQREAPKVSFS
jgi:LemA protein